MTYPRLQVTGLCLFLAGLVPSVGQSQVVINELLYDGDAEFLELHGPPGANLDGYQLRLLYSNGNTYRSITLHGHIIPLDQYFVVGDDDGESVDLVYNAGFLQGQAQVQLRLDGQIVDSICYGSSPDLVCEGTPADEVPEEYSLARCPDGVDTDDNAEDFDADVSPTPGSENDLICDPEPIDRTLCEIAQNDENGVPLLYGELVRVVGLVQNPSEGYGGASITDGDCCLGASRDPDDPILSVGDEIEVEGTVTHSRGVTYIGIPDRSITLLSSGNPIPDPVLVSTGELAADGEDYESCLIRIECADLVDPNQWPEGPDYAIVEIDDGSGPVNMILQSSSEIGGHPAPVNRFSVVGIGGQYDSTPPYDQSYRFSPRDIDDFTYDDPACGPFDSGACCVTSDSCVVLLESECQGANGFYLGDDSVCDPGVCGEDGACCVDPYCVCCIWLTWDECDYVSGYFQGPGSECYFSPNPTCVSGACCVSDGSCFVTIWEECYLYGWEYQGDDTWCDPNPCPPTSIEEFPTTARLDFAPPSPNPAAGDVRLSFSLGVESDVSITAYDVRGSEIDKIVSRRFEAGGHSLEWDTSSLASGRYYVLIRAGGDVVGKSIALTR